MKDLRDWVIVPVLRLLHFVLPAYLSETLYNIDLCRPWLTSRPQLAASARGMSAAC